jgi:hypothetical protein
MTDVQPGQTVEHTEHWALFREVKPHALTDEELDRVLAPLLKNVGTEQ